MYTIESNIPVPSVSGRGRKVKYPFATMKVGESFFSDDEKAYQNVSSSKCAFEKKNPGTKFTVRTDGKGVRCWRIA